MSEYFLSICIPAYNRPKELKKLLHSIDAGAVDDIEIVITEDMSPKREEIRDVVSEYKEISPYTVHYYENETNYGYDKNIRQTAKKAQGRWVMYMGNDDLFIAHALDKYINWMKKHDDLGYILRRYRAIWPDGSQEEHRYDKQDVFFASGEDAIIELYRRSIFISGFTFRKSCFNDYECDDFDGMLMFQIYIQSAICRNNPSAYCDIPITKWIVGGTPDFGKSESEKDLYEPGANTYQNSVNFLSQIGRLADGIDRKLGTNIKSRVMKSYSKYSFGYLFEHRDDGFKVYRSYAKEIKKLGLGDSIYFYIYYYALLIFGVRNCQKTIRLIKKVMGKTPKL